MKVVAEVFKGIEFVRISNLPEDQKELIATLIPKDRIIKILKDNVVIRDCVQYHDYVSLLYTQEKTEPLISQKKQNSSSESLPAIKFAFK